MGAHRELAKAAMNIKTQQSLQTDFMGKAGANIDLPQVLVKEALPAMLRQEVPARKMQMLVDMIMYFAIGDYPGERDYSTYYDPDSPWYNVFYGAYALRSYKLDGSAWGYRKNGEPDFDEFMKVPAVDYNFFQAGQFGCPPGKMCFDPTWKKPRTKSIRSGRVTGPRRPGARAARRPAYRRKDCWDFIEVETPIPSGLHDPRRSLGQPDTYVLYGVPRLSLLHGREQYEKVQMKGEMFMRRIPGFPNAKFPQPITLAFGVLCPSDPGGQALMREISDALWERYKGVPPA